MHQYLKLEKTEHGLNMSVLPDMLEDAKETAGFSELFEYQLGNGWDYVAPEEIAALTDDSNTIISDTVLRDDEGKLRCIESVYAYDDYMIYDIHDELTQGNTVFLRKY